MKLSEKAAQATGQTARLFLGMQVQCTQCHNHPFNDWKQDQFWGLNAFYRQAVSLRRFTPGTRDVRFVELTDQDFAGEGASVDPDDAEIYYELRNGIQKVAYPVFVDGKTVLDQGGQAKTSGYLDQFNRRKELGKLVARSDYLPRAMVNRMWSHFLGHGFTKPIDDMGPHNPPSHPVLLDYLARQFREQDYDLKRLIHSIVLSEAYGLSSRMNRSNLMDDPSKGETPKFSHFYVRQMRAEELYESLLVATEAHKTESADDEEEEAKQRWLSQFTVAFGRTKETRRRPSTARFLKH